MCRSAHAPTNRATATSAAATTCPSAGRLRLRICTTTGCEEGERDEGEEPRAVEIEPVRQHELEADQQRGRESRELERRLAAREARERDRAQHEPPLQAVLARVQ